LQERLCSPPCSNPWDAHGCTAHSNAGRTLAPPFAASGRETGLESLYRARVNTPSVPPTWLQLGRCLPCIRHDTSRWVCNPAPGGMHTSRDAHCRPATLKGCGDTRMAEDRVGRELAESAFSWIDLQRVSIHLRVVVDQSPRGTKSTNAPAGHLLLQISAQYMLCEHPARAECNNPMEPLRCDPVNSSKGNRITACAGCWWSAEALVPSRDSSASHVLPAA
jgi:hypothetical protein